MPRTQTKPTKKQTPAPDQIPATAATPERKITPFQELACDLFSSFLFENATPELAPDMIRLLAAMQYNRQFPDQSHFRETTPVQSAMEWVDCFESEWYAKFLRGIPEAPQAVKEPKPKNASEQIRGVFRKELHGYFANFLAGGTPEEIYLLVEVFRTWNSNNQMASGDRVEEVSIASAFETTITNRLGKVYVRVPEDAVESIEHLINFQQKEAA